ncbi:MAG TPA: SAF domain-containing protein [Acidimicrobiales bacterium]
MRNATRLSLSLARVRRSAFVTAGAAAVVAVASAGVAATLLQRAGDAASAFGPVVEVPVVVRAVPAGAVVGDGDVRDEPRPASHVPGAFVTRAGAVAGRVALVPLVPGEVVVDARLGDTLVPAGWRALAIAPPGVGTHPDVSAGDAVDVIDVGAEGGATVANGVVVAVRDDGTVTVAVPGDDAARVAYAATAGTAVVAITAPRRGR